jgi:hypothetical protein
VDLVLVGGGGGWGWGVLLGINRVEKTYLYEFMF